MHLETDKYEQVTAILKAMAHPVRLSIIHLLTEQKEMSVSDITQALDREQATISQHLQKMKLFGFLGTRREGKFVHYFLVEDRLPDVLRVIEKLAS